MSEELRAVFWTKRRGIACAVAITLSPFAYLLSAGPLVYMQGRGAISPKTVEAMAFPIVFAYDHNVLGKLGIEDGLRGYYTWWREKGEDVNKQAQRRQR